MTSRDGLLVSDTGELTITVLENSELLLMDVPMQFNY
jgi:hypothetical protein